MLIRFFRSSFFIQNLLIVLAGVVLWLPAFLHPSPPAVSSGLQPLYAGIATFLQPFPFLAVFLAFLFLLFSAFYLNAVLASNGLIGRVASAAALHTLVLFSLSPSQLGLYPILFALPLLVYLISVLFKMYESQRNEFNIFNAALAVSLLSMIDIRFIFLLPWLYVSLFVLRIIQLREWLIPLFGLMVPYFFLSVYYFMQNSFLTTGKNWIENVFLFKFSIPSLPSLVDGLSFILVILVFFQSAAIVASPVSDHSIFMRKKKAIINGLIVFALPLLFLYPDNPMQKMLLLLPFVVYIAYSWMLYRRFFWPQLLFLLLTGLAVLNQYIHLFR